ncbi:hypothetical protein [Pseudoscardovia suis]|uniref:Zinc metalloprotease n=1 Tax=Pseudoscardovia suis TaxID=987063 RepID=A0A261F516_9BIFI|nr:hypothetical protein [Pseudoscardovia suis]OZG53996.1 zinc metalloprotease [Pseudoscardovia suis]PJJ65765.1 hypothetical protein CLV65_1327 [Pseudoscardovia suis]
MSAVVLPGVRLLQPLDEGERWVVENPAGERFGVSPDVASILVYLQRVPDISAAGGRFGEDNVRNVVTMLSGCQVLRDDNAAPICASNKRRHEWGRLRVNSLFSIQVTILKNPSRIFAPFANFDFRKWMIAAAAALAIAFAGLIGIAADGASFVQDLAAPQSISSYFEMLLMMVFVISLHEYAHGAVLNSFGGQVSRIGVMLLYLAPACFCDVSDGWRLSSKKRMAVAAAGIISTFMLAGVCSLLRYLPGAPSFMASLVASLYVGAVINAIPTVKFDGYIALMAWREQPFLRSNAMRQWKIVVSDLLSGNLAEAFRNATRTAAYGVLCSLTPLVFVYSLFAVCDATLGSSGIGAIANALLLWLMLAMVIHGWVQIIRSSANSTDRVRGRLSTRAIVCSVVVFLVTLLFPVHVTSATSYASESNGTLTLLSPYGEELPIGETLIIQQQGLMGTRIVGTARVEGSTHAALVPAGIYSPAIAWPQMTDIEVRAQDAAVDAAEGATVPAFGRVVWDDGQSSLAEWLYRQLVLRPFKALAMTFQH